MFAWITSLSSDRGVLAIIPLYNLSSPETNPDHHITVGWLCILHTHKHTQTHCTTLSLFHCLSVFSLTRRHFQKCQAITDFWVFVNKQWNKPQFPVASTSPHVLMHCLAMKCQMVQRHQLFKNNIIHTLNRSVFYQHPCCCHGGRSPMATLILGFLQLE